MNFIGTQLTQPAATLCSSTNLIAGGDGGRWLVFLNIFDLHFRYIYVYSQSVSILHSIKIRCNAFRSSVFPNLNPKSKVSDIMLVISLNVLYQKFYATDSMIIIKSIVIIVKLVRKKL